MSPKKRLSKLPKRPPRIPSVAPVSLPEAPKTFDQYWDSLSPEGKHQMRRVADQRGLTLQSLYRNYKSLCP